MPFARRIPVRHLLMLRLVLNIQTQTDSLAMESREKINEKQLRINQIGYNSTSSSIRFKRAKEFRYSGVMWFDFDTPAMSTPRRKTVGVQVFHVTEKNGTFASFFH